MQVCRDTNTHENTQYIGVVLWGAGNIDKLIIFQNKFLRQLFYLPNEATGCKLLLETHMKPIEGCVLSLLLKFLYRLQRKAKESLVKTCFHRLITINTDEAGKHNWFSQVSTFLLNCGVKGLNYDLQIVSSKLKSRKITNKYYTNFINENVKFRIDSNAMYKDIKCRVGTESYLKSELSFSVKKSCSN